MARDITQLHPKLQEIIPKLIEECKKQDISIKIGECLRTVKEQDELYAQGRTKPGSVVTNAKGSNYSSMHQWGVAFDFYLDMDIDGDGTKSDDAFNNSKKTFQKVGAIGKNLGLEWGGDWRSIVDMPHFQLDTWGSDAKTLKATYKTPKKFFASWKEEKKSATTTKTSTSKTTTKTSTVKVVKVDSAKEFSSKYNKRYTTTSKLNLRTGAKMDKTVLVVMPKGVKVDCYGYYTKNSDGSVWMLVNYKSGSKTYTGFCSKKYLK